MFINDVLFCFIIWQKFEVTDWPEEDYGKFYSGDSYIILNVSFSDLSFIRKSNKYHIFVKLHMVNLIIVCIDPDLSYTFCNILMTLMTFDDLDLADIQSRTRQWWVGMGCSFLDWKTQHSGIYFIHFDINYCLSTLESYGTHVNLYCIVFDIICW